MASEESKHAIYSQVRLVPASNLVTLPWAPGHSMVLADMCTPEQRQGKSFKCMAYG